MAVTVTQTVTYDDASSVTSHHKTSLTATAANSTLVIAVRAGTVSATTQTSSITDGASNTWTSRVSKDGSGTEGVSIWSTANTAASITDFTITTAGNAAIQSQFWEVAGAGAVDVSNSATGASTAPASGSSGTPTSTTDLAIGIIAWFAPIGGSSTISASTFSPFGAGTQQTHGTGGTLTDNARTGAAILASATAQNFQGTLSLSSVWEAAILTFKAGASISACSPVTGQIETAISITGTGFATAHAITITIGGVQANFVTGSTTDGSGNVSAVFAAAPGTPIGLQTVTVSDGTASISTTYTTIALNNYSTQNQLNNYMFVKGGDGASMGDKIR